MSVNRQDWDESTQVGSAAVKAVNRFLKSETAKKKWKDVRINKSVEDRDHFQKREIDLLLVVFEQNSLFPVTIEVKGDRNHQTGNFFLETMSDVDRQVGGAFVVCEADWYFYFFIHIAKLYCLPMKETKAWFESNKSDLKETFSHSERKGRTWSTKGSLAPIARVIKEVSGVVAFSETEGAWSHLNI